MVGQRMTGYVVGVCNCLETGGWRGWCIFDSRFDSACSCLHFLAPAPSLREFLQQRIGLLLLLGKGRVQCHHLVLSGWILCKKSKEFHASLLHVGIPVLSAKMANHLDFFPEGVVLYCQFGERVEHHRPGLVAGAGEVLVYGLENAPRVLARLHQIFAELRHYVAAHADQRISDVGQVERREQSDSGVVLQVGVRLAKT